MGDFKGNYQRLVADPFASLWFKRFIEGMRNRMCQLMKPNRALSHPLIIKLIRHLEVNSNIEVHNEEAHL